MRTESHLRENLGYYAASSLSTAEGQAIAQAGV
jgi:hypothetical protein